MGRPRRVWCRICDRHVSECGPLSARGKCRECGEQRMIANIVAMEAKTGPVYLHWRRRHAAAVGGVLLEDLDEGR